MRLNDLGAVVAVANHRSFRAAASELGMSPSALSHAISSLEQRLGVRLFHRTTRSVALSDAGQQFLARVQPALREIDEALESASEQSESLRGTLRLNASRGGARHVLMPVVLEYLRRHPDMHVDLVTDDALVDIVAGGFDAGLRDLDTVPRDMVALPASREVSFVVVGAPRYFRGRSKPSKPAELSEHKCIRRRWPSGAIYRWEFERRGRELSIDVSGSLTLDNDELMLEAALRGVGLAYLSSWQANSLIAAGRLIRVLEDWTPAYPGLHLHYSSQRQLRPALRAFIDVMRELAPRLPA